MPGRDSNPHAPGGAEMRATSLFVPAAALAATAYRTADVKSVRSVSRVILAGAPATSAPYS